MKKVSKFFACAAVALMMASCGNPVKSAKDAIENNDFVEAAKCISKLSVEDINDMEAAEQVEVLAIGAAIEMSGNEEASKILNDNIDLNKVEQKEMKLDDIFGL